MGRTGIAKKATARFRFFGDVIAELRKVVWPTRQEAWNSTLVVIVTVVIFTILLFTFDVLLSQILKLVFGSGV